MIYIIHETGSPFYKIGYTGRGIGIRVNELQTGNPRKLRLVASIKGTRGTWRMEQYIHGLLKPCRVGRYTKEWYDVSRQQNAIKIIEDTFDISLKSTFNPEVYSQYAEEQYQRLKQVNSRATRERCLSEVFKTNGEPANPGEVKPLGQWSKGKTRILLLSRGFSMAQFLNGEPFDRHQDDAISVVSLLMSQGHSREDAVMCALNMAALITQGHPRMRKLWTIGKDSIHTSIDNAKEICDMVSHTQQPSPH